MEDIGPAAALYARYVELLRADGYFESREWPYSFGAFDNGVPIPDFARRLYQELGEDVDRFGDPFQASGPGSYFRWLNEPAEGPSGSSGGDGHPTLACRLPQPIRPAAGVSRRLRS